MINYSRNIRGGSLLIFTAILLFGSGCLHAQQDRYNWRFGLGVGNQYVFGNPYNADSIGSNGIVELDPSFLSYSAFLELSLSQSFGLKLFTTTRPQDYVVTNSGLLLSYYFDNDYLFGSKAIIAPYISLGGAFGEMQNSFNVPFGGGLKFRVSSRVNINVDFTARSYTDRWSESDFDFGKELSGYSSVSVHYNFGKKPRAYNAPKPYVSPYAQPQAAVQKAKPSAPEMVQKEVVIPEISLDRMHGQMDTNIAVIVDTAAFRATPTDSLSKVDFLNRYGKILKTPKLGDSTRALNFENAYYSDTSGTSPAKGAESMRLGAVPKSYSARDSTLAALEFEIKQQKLKNELNLLRKAEKDTSLIALLKENEALRLKLQTADQYSGLSQRIAELESQPNQVTTTGSSPSNTYTPTGSTGTNSEYSGGSYQPTSSAAGVGSTVAGTAVVGGIVASESERVKSLEAKVDTLQQQLISLQRILLAQNIKPVAALVVAPDSAAADTIIAVVADSIAVDSVETNASILHGDSASSKSFLTDTVKNEKYITETELNTLRENLAKTQQEVDSLIKVKPQVQEVPKPVKEVALIPKTFFETTGKVEVFFDISSSSLNSESRKKLDDMIEYAKSRSDAKFLIKGFTDKTGSIAFNKALSDKRAKAVEQYLTSGGVAAERLKVMSIGPDQSLTGGSHNYGRRVEVILN